MLDPSAVADRRTEAEKRAEAHFLKYEEQRAKKAAAKSHRCVCRGSRGGGPARRGAGREKKGAGRGEGRWVGASLGASKVRGERMWSCLLARLCSLPARAAHLHRLSSSPAHRHPCVLLTCSALSCLQRAHQGAERQAGHSDRCALCGLRWVCGAGAGAQAQMVASLVWF